MCSRFTIHGLWPEFKNDTWPQYCTKEDFDPAQVADLRPVLRREWPSVFSNNTVFWRHEWRKHGTCAENLCPLLSDEHSFFFAVLALNQMYDLNVRPVPNPILLRGA
jgi:ribonuclease T2